MSHILTINLGCKKRLVALHLRTLTNSKSTSRASLLIGVTLVPAFLGTCTNFGAKASTVSLSLSLLTQVFHAALKLLRLLLSQLIPGLGRAEVTHCVDQTWPNLLARAGDSAGRLRGPAAAFIQVSQRTGLNQCITVNPLPTPQPSPHTLNYMGRVLREVIGSSVPCLPYIVGKSAFFGVLLHKTI